MEKCWQAGGGRVTGEHGLHWSCSSSGAGSRIAIMLGGKCSKNDRKIISGGVTRCGK